MVPLKSYIEVAGAGQQCRPNEVWLGRPFRCFGLSRGQGKHLGHRLDALVCDVKSMLPGIVEASPDLRRSGQNVET
jgi:hypothetical protein